jgi:membrane protease YdiL (CAAX protease family)
MIEAFGVSKAILLLGLFWSFWHLPLLLVGYNHPENPILGAFVLSPIELVGVSFFYGWLTIRSGSFWPAAIAHAAGNSIQEGVVSHLHLLEPALYSNLYRTATAVIVGLICWVALVAGRKGRRSAGAV